jgi:NADPH2:quinone reductase
MKAIRVHEFGPPDVMKLEEVADPKPGPLEVLVRVHAAGVNPVETYVRSGTYANKPALPYTPGSDASGVVVAAGEEIGRFRVGDRVYTAGTLSGSYAQLALARVNQIYPLPENVSFAQGAGVHVPYATAYRALFQRFHGQAGQKVLIHGASGGVGIAAVQFAAALGMIVIGTAGTEAGRKLVRAQGAHHVLDHRSPDYLEQLLKLTDQRGVDVILEMLANANLGKDLTVLARGGTVVVIGSRGNVEITPRDLMRNESQVVGLMGGKPEEVAQAHIAIGAGLRAGTLKPIVGKELPLSDAPRAHREIIEGTAYGKIVLVPEG